MTSDLHNKNTLAAIPQLREAGFALHWLHPRQKRPVGNGWAEAPVSSLERLRATHAGGYNLGVRLGEPSLLESGEYLHVFDVDIRIDELADEAWAALSKLLPSIKLDTLPSVVSGSGGESRHKYFVSDRPFRKKALARSEGKHRGKDGKWHYDWEIDIFGTGTQVVLPPSIHPDTGKPYTWEREFDFDDLAIGGGPFISSKLLSQLGAVEDQTHAYEEREPLDFKPGQMDAELSLISVSDLHYDDWIMLGQALHHQTGASEEGFELWLTHTKRSVKFDGDIRTMKRKWRSFGRYRGKPVTMATIRSWAQDARSAALVDEFDDLPEDADEGDDFDDLLASDDDDSDFDDLVDQPTTPKPKAEESKPSNEWVSLLDIVPDTGAIKGTVHNLRLIVSNDPRTAGVAAFNEFTQEIVQRGAPKLKPARRKASPKPVVQLEGRSWEVRDPINGDFWTEDKDDSMRAVFEAPKTQGGYGIKIPDRDLRAAINISARKNCFHPVREYLTSLKWDGKKRVESLFSDYMGAKRDSYHYDVSRIMMVAAVTRVFEPGAKFDTAVILEGLQGKRKSTFISTLSKGWFVELDGDFTDTKQMVENLQGAWIVEMPELSGFAKADVRHIKAFISRRSDKVRLAYAKRAQEFHRQNILIGSTNDDVYLKDSTGGRRFLPVKCSVDMIDTDRLAKEIDQLWAEAYAIYVQMRKDQPRGTLPLYLANAESRQIAERLQESRKVESSEDALAGRIEEWLNRPIVTGDLAGDLDEDGKPMVRNQVCLLEIWCECLGKEESQYIGAWPSTLGRAMRLVPGWTETARRIKFGKFGQQRAFQREGWIPENVRPK